MKSKAFIILAYLKFLLKSGTRHSVHSPFVYTLVDKVFKNSSVNAEFLEIQKRLESLLKKVQIIEITDFGHGSANKEYEHRFESVASIVRKSAVAKKYGRLLFRLVEYFKPHTIIELGTSIGLSTLYLAKPIPEALVYTVEGCAAKAEQAADNFRKLRIHNIEQHIGKFSIVLPDLIHKIKELDFAFIDGHHTYEATIANFETLLRISHNDTIFIFDDIHWSAEMEKAWNEITEHSKVTVSIDIFRMGIVFLRKELSRQKFVIRL